MRDFNPKSETIKFLEESIGCKLLDVHLGNVCLFVCFGFDIKSKGCQSKTKQVGLDQTKKLLQNKGNHQQNEKAVCGNGRKYL